MTLKVIVKVSFKDAKSAYASINAGSSCSKHMVGTDEFKVEPSYSNWSSWIAPMSVSGSGIVNTEYKKCPQYQDAQPEVVDGDKELSEEFLIELLCESDVSILYLSPTIIIICVMTS